jgi:Protein of unknown function (DUF3467)
MSEEKQESKSEATPQDAPDLEWLKSDEVFEAYSNILHLNWSPHDVRIRFGQLIADPRTSPQHAKWVVNEYAAITLAWGEAKYLRDILHAVVKDYEAKNGKIVMPILPTPTGAEEPKE